MSDYPAVDRDNFACSTVLTLFLPLVLSCPISDPSLLVPFALSSPSHQKISATPPRSRFFCLQIFTPDYKLDLIPSSYILIASISLVRLSGCFPVSSKTFSPSSQSLSFRLWNPQFQRHWSPRLSQPRSPSFVKLSPIDVLATLLTTFHPQRLPSIPALFSGAPFSSHLSTPFQLNPSPLELPHRTSLTVLPLQEEGSRRLGPVNLGCETFRPP